MPLPNEVPPGCDGGGLADLRTTPESLRIAGKYARPDRQRREDLERQLEALGRIIRNNAAQCPNPGHQDEKPSASIYQKDCHWRVHCHVCEKSWDAWDLAAQNAGLELKEWIKQTAEDSPAHKPALPMQRKPAYATYSTMEEAAEAAARLAGGKAVDLIHHYLEPGIETRFAVVRMNPKDFRPIYKDSEGWHIGDLPGKLPLYNLTKVNSSETLVICEGEKDCDTLGRHGIPAVTSAHGAKSPDKTDWTPLQGKRVVIWPDNDEAGIVYAQRVRTILEKLPTPPQIRQIDPKRLPVPTKDVSDLVAKLPPMDDHRATVAKIITEAEGPKRKTLVLRSHADRLRDRGKKRDFLVEGLLAVGDLAGLIANPKTGKSLIAQSLAEAVAMGGRFAFQQCRQGRVLYACADSPGSTERRMLALDPAAAENVASVCELRLDPAGAQTLADTMAQEREAGRPFALAIIDTWDATREHNGGSWSGEDAAVEGAMRHLRSLCESEKVAVLVVHHGTRANAGQARGSQCFDARLDLALVVEAQGQGSIGLSVAFARDGEAGPVADGRIVTVAPPAGVEADSLPKIEWMPDPGTRLSEREQALMIAMDHDPKAPVRTLATAAAIARGTAQDALVRLERQGLVARGQGLTALGKDVLRKALAAEGVREVSGQHSDPDNDPDTTGQEPKTQEKHPDTTSGHPALSGLSGPSIEGRHRTPDTGSDRTVDCDPLDAAGMGG